MFWNSLAALAPAYRRGRGPLNTKRAPTLKKGYGAVGIGHHTKDSKFIINTSLIPRVHVPDLADFKLKPYVTAEIEAAYRESVKKVRNLVSKSSSKKPA